MSQNTQTNRNSNRRRRFGFVVDLRKQARIGAYISGLALIFSAAFVLLLFNALSDQHLAMAQAGTAGDWDAIESQLVQHTAFSLQLFSDFFFYRVL